VPAPAATSLERSKEPVPPGLAQAPGWSRLLHAARSGVSGGLIALREPDGTPVVLGAGETLRFDPPNAFGRYGGILSQVNDADGFVAERSSADPLGPVRAAIRHGGSWAGWLSYDIGRLLEPAAAARRPRSTGWPLILLREVRHASDAVAVPPRSDGSGSRLSASTATSATSPWGRAGYTLGVERVLDYIRDGDCYQVNLAHTLVAPFEGSPRAAFATLADRADPPFAMYVEAPPEPLTGGGTRHLAMLSLSPELFLDYDAASRRVVTRPMKGTRPCVPGALEELEASEKDRAELAMIVDLMRNDLGRVCDVGSVRVDVPRRIERHDNAAGGVWQAIAQVSGTLRPECDAADLIAATFPAGSVTGAPKIRAMQIIDELEPEPRGIYCGSGIHIRADGSMTLSVAIRTALIEGVSHAAAAADASIAPADDICGTLRYSVGAGIVADSVPDAEWRETLVKAGPLGGLVDLRSLAANRLAENHP